MVRRWGAWLPPFDLRPWASPRPCASLVSLHEGRAVGDHPYTSASSAPLKSTCRVAAVSPSRRPESLPLGDSSISGCPRKPELDAKGCIDICERFYGEKFQLVHRILIGLPNLPTERFSTVAHRAPRGICREKTIFSCIFQDCMDEKMGPERQSGLPWGNLQSLRDTHHSPFLLCPLPLTTDLEGAQGGQPIGDASCLVMPPDGWAAARGCRPSGGCRGPDHRLSAYDVLGAPDPVPTGL